MFLICPPDDDLTKEFLHILLYITLLRCSVTEHNQPSSSCIQRVVLTTFIENDFRVI